MTSDVCEYEYQLGDDFFSCLDEVEIQKGDLHVSLQVTKTSGVYELDFQTEGEVVVTCDRCLDEMNQPVKSLDQLRVRLGEEYDEQEDMIIVPEDEGTINVAWYLYEFIALSIPMKHIHEPGECNEEMLKALSKHLRTIVDGDDEDEDDFDFPSDDETEEDESRPIDPRWNELKKILDNN